MTQAAAREQAHKLLDMLPPEQLSAVVCLLEGLAPASRPTPVAWEDEPISSEETAQASAANGPWFDMQEVMSELGITQEELDLYEKEERAKAQVR